MNISPLLWGGENPTEGRTATVLEINKMLIKFPLAGGGGVGAELGSVSDNIKDSCLY